MYFFGIQYSKSPVSLAWELNRNQEFAFFRVEDLFLQGYNPADKVLFTRFQHVDELNHLDFDLVSNHFGDQSILPEIKQLDFLLAVKGGLDMFEERPFLQLFRKQVPSSFIGKIENNKQTNKLKRIF